MSDARYLQEHNDPDGPRLRKAERREHILLELKLHPHVRISDLARRFGVSAETVRRDFDALSRDGLISRNHGGASAPAQGYYPGLDERANARIEERSRIGRRAADLVGEGDTLMIDSGSTTIQFARALAWRGVQCTVITNSLPVAMTLGHGTAEVLLCPGAYLPAESAVIGTETLEFLERFHVDHCMIGASGLSAGGPTETVRGFAAVKRMMLKRSAKAHLLIDAQKFGHRGFNQVGTLDQIDTVVVDTPPEGALHKALASAQVTVCVAI
ncbi:transcriptional regulator, DeoR family [Cribrihabitans marinus]|uniref:Transcriptional regulator, DeoR family n=1 Tax=Cribrihabitans marinus TaxID=1227549 RepID=A0A1H6ZFY6_9RHOB|nr:DeoR/GlpR family DNA-binding transcription regulator [Cribrihabitans marinus]GGH31316.1 DeoR family transcriptional regulator [Cribrihabitans marinus]SEJ48582.1 transcriptional regulator, DeoR family [Cribrihabitans marinus]